MKYFLILLISFNCFGEFEIKQYEKDSQEENYSIIFEKNEHAVKYIEKMRKRNGNKFNYTMSNVSDREEQKKNKKKQLINNIKNSNLEPWHKKLHLMQLGESNE